MAYHPQGKENGVQMTHLIYHHGRRSDELERAGLARKTLAGAFNSRPCQFSSAAGSSGSVHGGLSVPAVASSSSSGGLRQGTIDGAFSRSAAPESSDGANRASYYR